MGYDLRAIIGFETVLAAFKERFKMIRIARLEEGLALIPITDELLAELESDKELPLAITLPDFSSGFPADNLTDKLIAFLQESSAFGPLAYCEAEYHGGSGGQIAILWQAQKIILGPICTRWGQFGQPLNKVRGEEMSINCVLRRLGVRPQRGKDEFEIVGLGRKRRTEAWS